MSESEGFILKAEQFNQEEWCEMFIRVSETCKDLRVENECLQKQLQQEENIRKEVREFIEKREFVEVEIINEPFNDDFDFKDNILNILDKVNK